MAVSSFPTAHDALALLEPLLSAAGAEAELALGLLNRLRDEPDAWGRRVAMLLAAEDGVPVAFVMRTGTAPALVVGLCEHAAEIEYAPLVHELQRLDHVPNSVNGPVRCSVPFAAAWTRETGVATRTLRELRAFELHELRLPELPAGRARPAVEADAPLLERWCTEFGRDIGEELGPGDAERTVARFIAAQDMMVWDSPDGPTSMAAINRRTSRSSCVAWVYTPPEQRGRGYASAVVAAISQRELDAGARWCSLFTDLANPTSNHIYAQLGYEPRCDFRHIELLWEPGSGQQ